MKTDLEKIRRQLRKMAFGKPNDCVKLAMCEDVDIEKLAMRLSVMHNLYFYNKLTGRKL